MEPRLEVDMAETPQRCPLKVTVETAAENPLQCTIPESGNARDIEMEASCRQEPQTDQAQRQCQS